MKAAVIGVIVVIVIVVIIFIAFPIVVKNGLVSKDEAVNEAWAQIETQLTRRTDLIPNLVSTVKGYAAHEKEIFTDISKARARLIDGKTPSAKAAANGMLNSALGRLLAISENYPNLKANQSFIRLQDELAGTENRIAVARTRYNNSVKIFNSSIRKFPGNLYATSMGFSSREYFTPPKSKNIDIVPKVKF
ncbi:MAG TPA: LemA family protein [Victivallales bacterium]|nr:LemA family protein [Victivallales bacterium]